MGRRMSVTEITIKRAAAEVKEQANMYARGVDWEWKKVEDMIRNATIVAITERMLENTPDERPNRE